MHSAVYPMKQGGSNTSLFFFFLVVCRIGHYPMQPEHTGKERFPAYANALQERFRQGMLAELQPLKQWVVWRGEVESGKAKKVPYNPKYQLIHASVKIP